MQAILITIGDEILNGQTQDTNSSAMARMLSKIGVFVEEFRSVKDQVPQIISAIDESLKKADVVLTTGGLGPTKDDKTRDALCTYFKVDLVQDDEVKANVERILSGNTLTLDLNYKQSFIPANATPLINAKGTAPALHFQLDNKQLFVMPGVPYEMHYLMQEYILPNLKTKVSNDHIDYRYLYIYNVPESILSKELESFEDNLGEGISLSYLPDLNLVKLRLTFANQDTNVVDECFEELKNTLPKNTFYTEGDKPLELQMGELLTNKGLNLGIAESCTGGYLSHLITSVSGASTYYLGSLVSYAYDVKNTLLKVNKEQMIRDGAVSKETVEQMASEVNNLLNADCGIAISGIAGPGGGTDEKPVGTVWISTNYKGELYSKQYRFKGDRFQVILRSARNAMIQLMQQVEGQLLVK